MSHHFTFTVSVAVDRVSGKFVSRDELAEKMTEALTEALEGVDMTGLGADSDSEYTIVESDVAEA